MAVSINLKLLEEYCLNLKKLYVQYFVPNSIMTTDRQIKKNEKRSQVIGEYAVMILVLYREPPSRKGWLWRIWEMCISE